MDSGRMVSVKDKNAKFRDALKGGDKRPAAQPVGPLPAGSYRLTDAGQMKALSQNIVVYLGAVLPHALGWDMLSDQPVWRQKPPFLPEYRAEIHDQDASELAFWASDQLGADFKTVQALEAIQVHSKRNPFHPVQHYLSGLHWDGTPRIDHWLADAFGVTASDYHRAVARSFLIAAIARCMTPGCQVDTMLVLMGDQGLGKTSAVRELAPDFSMYAETTESPANKDFYQALRGKWIVEIGELHSFRNADWTKIKQMLSAKVDTYRPSYGHFTKDFPRQCVFIGTTNDDQWNRDPTGARRFWPVKCLEVNRDYIRQQRDQLWAEAAECYRKGEGWWDVPDTDEHTQAVYEADPWEEPVLNFMAKYPTGSYVTARQILIEVLGFTDDKIGQRENTRVGSILKNKKFTHKRVMHHGAQRWVWVT
jgi:putative DNA primase/helicase